MRTCTAATSSRRTTRAPISGSSSSTMRATRPPAGTGRSRSSPGRSTRAIVAAAEGENRVVVDVPSGPARDRRGRSRRPRPVGDVPQRPLVRLGHRRPRSESPSSTSRSAAPSTRRLRERVEPRELPRLIELGREIKRGLEARARDRPPPRAGASRRLRRHLLAARGGRAADPAQRDGVRGRRGRPLAVRLRHLGAARAARRVRRSAPWRRAARICRSSGRASRVVSSTKWASPARRAVVTEVTGSAACASR